MDLDETSSSPFLGESSRDVSFQQKKSSIDAFATRLAKGQADRICPVCSRHVQSISIFRTCINCERCVHQECDEWETSALEDFACPSCRRSPLVNDPVLAKLSPSSPLLSASGTQDFPPSSSYGFPSARSSPACGSMDIEMSGYAGLGESAEEGLSAGADERLSGSSSLSSSESGGGPRHSPVFCPENSPPSDDGDEFRPSGRGSHAGRGGRGGAKKKPGGRGGSLMKTRSGGQPPSGVFLDRLGKAERPRRGSGKARGKANGSTRGRRGRGSSSLAASLPSCSSLVSSASTSRLLDSEDVDGDESTGCGSRHSGTGALLASYGVRIGAGGGKKGGAAASASGSTVVSSLGEQMTRTAVVCSEADMFLLHTALCLVCGSVGGGAEGSMVACSSCAHTYHTFCVNLHDKMNWAVVSRGWRCLDCIVCEGCGESRDERNLLLCEECDVAYHIYCLNPPLDRIPQGTWRCHWCAKCRRCSKRVSCGSELSREGLCQTCHSLRKCPKCLKLYVLGEPIIRCSNCDRWYHGRCEDLHSEEQLENASLNRMRCSSCRPNSRSAISSNDHTNLVLCDNVALNRSADEILQSKWMPSMLRAGSELPASLSELRSASFDSHLGGSMDEDMMGDELDFLSMQLPLSGPGSRGGRGGRGGGTGRGRMAKLGVGGFFVKVPRHRLMAFEEDEFDADGNKKPKRARKPRRSQLEDAYPGVIQEGFFGVRAVEGKNLLEAPVDEPQLALEYSRPHGRHHAGDDDPAGHGGALLSREATEALRNDINETGFLEDVNINDYMNIDDVNFDNFFDDDDDFNDDLNDAYAIAAEDGFSLDGSQADSSTTAAAAGPGGLAGPPGTAGGQQPTQQLSTQQLQQQQRQHLPQQRPPMHFPPGQMVGEGGGGSMSGYGMAGGMERAQQQQPGMARSGGGGPGGQSEQGGEKVSAANAATERWEEDEPLGDKATKAAVLFVNMNHPNLRAEHPEWSERVKHIQRIWRGLDTEKRQEYVNRARANRAAREKPVRQARAPRPAMPAGSGPGVQLQPPPPGIPRPALASTHGSYPQPGHPVAVQPQQHMQHAMVAGAAAGGVAVEFKVPTTPLASSTLSLCTSGVEKLNMEDRSRYDQIVRKAVELSEQQEAHEKDLAQMRKLKKNLAAKRRQIQKSAGVDDAGQAIPADLNDADRVHLQELNDNIPPRQKVLEQIRKDVKQLQLEKAQFEQDKQIVPLEGLPLAAPPQGGLEGVPGGPPGGTLFSPMASSSPSGTPRPFQQLVVPQHMPFGQMVSSVADDNISMGSLAAAAPVRGRGRWPVQQHRSSSLASGKIRFEQLHSQVDKDVYDVVDSLIEKVSVEQDGLPLKRFFDGSASHSFDSDQPKPKKKRQMQKKVAASNAACEYETALEKVKGHLALCPRFPKVAIEPCPRNEAAAFADLGLSDLAVRDRHQPSDAPQVPYGCLKLPFVNDIYADTRAVHLPPPPSMAALAPNARVTLLALQPDDPPQFPLVAKWESYGEAALHQPAPPPAFPSVSYSSSDPFRGLLFGVEKRRPILKCLTKIPESAPPNEQHRMAFSKPKIPEDELVDVSVELFESLRSPEMKGEEESEESMARLEGGEEKKEERVVGSLEGARQRARLNSVRIARQEAAARVIASLVEMLGVHGSSSSAAFQLDTPPLSPTEAAISGARADAAALPLGALEVKREVLPLPQALAPPPVLAPPPFALHLHHHPSTSRSSCCRLCDGPVAEQSVIRQSMSHLGLTPSDDGEEEVSFCSLKCYYIFVADSKVPLSPEQLQRAEGHCDEATYTRLKQISADSFARCIQQGKMKWEAAAAFPPHLTDGLLTSPRDTRALMDEGRKDNIHVIRCSDLAALSEDAHAKEKARAAAKDWQVYSQQLLQTFLDIHTHKQQLATMPKLGIESPSRMPNLPDDRVCVLCHGCGDGDPSHQGRLLNLDASLWIHVNCALWSSEVYETASGALVNVGRAVLRSRSQICMVCGEPGATVQCFKTDCQKNFHLPCANRMYGRFLRDKTFLCSQHVDVHTEVVVSLVALRRLYIERDENALLMKMFELTDGPRLVLRLGALTFHRLGQLLPDQLKTCHNARYIYPIGYTVSRLFWSPSDHRRRVRYSLTITEREGHPLFSVSPPDGPAHSSGTPTAAWKDIVEGVARARCRTDLLKLFPARMEGETLFGLNEPTITKMTESLPGVDTLFTYSFRHGGSPVMELPLAENPSGCARCEPRMRTLIKHHKTAPSSGRMTGTMTGGGSSSSLMSEMELMMKASGYRNDSSKWGGDGYGSTEQSYSSYQKMRKEWRQTVYLARSKIQGLGLYAKRDIDMGAMIIEYKGEVIRAEVGEMREKRYFAQNRGTYMFRIDDQVIIDATMAGGPARYINHSCDPNCATHIMPGATPEDKKIIITANRPIKADEELTYDYQFDVEDTSEKLACLCGAPNCQRWMN